MTDGESNYTGTNESSLYGFKDTESSQTENQAIWQTSTVIGVIIVAAIGYGFCSHFVFGKKIHRKDYQEVNQTP